MKTLENSKPEEYKENHHGETILTLLTAHSETWSWKQPEGNDRQNSGMNCGAGFPSGALETGDSGPTSLRAERKGKKKKKAKPEFRKRTYPSEMKEKIFSDNGAESIYP